jgi:hypothetical protein
MVNEQRCPVVDKICYTREAAKRAAKRMRHQAGPLGRHMSSYECPHHAKHPKGAGKFHVGHTPSSRRKWHPGPL